MLNVENTQVQKWIRDVYEDIYSTIYDRTIIVFLCGAASSRNSLSIRDKIRSLIEESKYEKIKIFYPEDLLIEILNKTKDADLLSYEQLLANNSHVICIICESPGSLVELGAFTNNNYTVNKVIAAIEKKREKDKSFIMLGPIKYLSKLDKKNVIKYGKDFDKLSKELIKSIKVKYSIASNKDKLDISSIMGMHYYIQLILYFFKKLNSMELANIIKYVLTNYKIPLENFNVIYNAALKLLFQEKCIVKFRNEKYSDYQLTKMGYNSIILLIKNCTNMEECDKIRLDIMYNHYYKLPLP